MVKAVLYRKREDNLVECEACCQKCVIKEGNTGLCGVRKNIEGDLYLLVYGSLIATNIDPIEKKPFNYFMSGSKTFSIGTVGCNFACDWCQNWDISQGFKDKDSNIKGERYEPEDIVNGAIDNGCISIAYTYTEPTIFIEFIKDISSLAKKKGIKNVWVTNGYMTGKAFDYIKDYIDAMNIDLKCFKNDTYKKFCNARKGIQPVLDTIKRAFKANIHIEITTLIIPGINDTDDELNEISKFIYDIDGKGDIPWHISRFFPMFKMDDKSPTDLKIIEKAFEIGKKNGLKKINRGNI
ncbi:MAG: AmmeMemoRadiSam system radical SAM enzyme [Nanobdellota archaeon]